MGRVARFRGRTILPPPSLGEIRAARRRRSISDIHRLRMYHVLVEIRRRYRRRGESPISGRLVANAHQDFREILANYMYRAVGRRDGYFVPLNFPRQQFARYSARSFEYGSLPWERREISQREPRFFFSGYREFPTLSAPARYIGRRRARAAYTSRGGVPISERRYVLRQFLLTLV